MRETSRSQLRSNTPARVSESVVVDLAQQVLPSPKMIAAHYTCFLDAFLPVQRVVGFTIKSPS